MNRYGRLKEWVIAPLKKLMEAQPRMREKMPFDVKLKAMELAYGIDKVLHQDLPKLTHGNDGLIFTSATAPYQMGTDPKILKWKPPSENSIDFRLELRFPPLADDPTEADFYAKPLFVLMMNCGKDGEQFFDTLEMSDEEWRERKERREQLDNRVVEVVWDAPKQTWKILRFRDDKKNGNYRDVVFSILHSIRDGVEATELSKHSSKIRAAWKARAQASSSKPSGSKSPPRIQQASDFNQSKKSPTRSQRPLNIKSPPPSHSHFPGASRPPKPFRTVPTSGSSVVPVNIIGGNPHTRGKKKKYTVAQVGTVAATLRRI